MRRRRSRIAEPGGIVESPPGGSERNVATDEAGNTCFLYERNDFTLFFTAKDLKPENATLMWFRAFEEPKFLAIAVWLGERQHLWSEWRTIAETAGAKALSRHLTSIADRDTWMEEVVTAMLISHNGSAPEVTVVADLATRRVEFMTHRFRSFEHRNAILDWANDTDAEDTAKALLLVGLLQGRRALARHMDGIASGLLNSHACSSRGTRTVQ
jgi:hypothetical protein